MTHVQAGSVFVGRDHELGALLEGLEEAASGRGHLVLLGGEPGIGKSRLADELAARTRERGFRVLWGRGWEEAGAPPYWPWVQALRSYVRTTDASEVRRHLGAGAADVAHMLPELRDLLPDIPTRPETESESARFQLFDSVATFLRSVSQAEPMLIVIDDLHAADVPSVLFLRFLATQLSTMSVLVVGAYRDIELTPDHPLVSAIAELSREPTTRVQALQGLEREAVRTFIGAAANLAPHDHVVSAVWRASKGNPLFASEAVRLLSAEGHLNDLPGLSSLRLAVPSGVRAVIGKRIGHLSTKCIRALTLGAILGPEFSLEVVRRLDDHEGDELFDLIDEAVQAGLLLPVFGARQRYRFSHDLVRETLYDDLTQGDQARLHQRIAEVLEDLYSDSIESHLAELAFHFVEAVSGPGSTPARSDAEQRVRKASQYAKRAGDQAARSLAYEEAARLYRMVLVVAELVESPDEVSRTEVLLALGEVESRSGDLDSARATLLNAADSARRTVNAEHLAQAALGYGGRLQWARPGKDTRLIPLLQDALVMLGGGNARLRAMLLTRLACAWRSSPERRNDSAALSQQAVDLARQLNDPQTLSYVLTGRFWAIAWPENPAERQRIAEEAVEVAEEDGDRERIADAHLLMFYSRSEMGRLVEARNEVDVVRRLVDELRQPAQQWLGVAPRAELALIEGDYALAEEMIERESVAGRQITMAQDDVSTSRMHRFLARREQGRVAEEEAATRAAVEDFPWYPHHKAALVVLLVDLNRTAEARAVFDDLARDAFHALYRDSQWLLGIGLVSEACALLGDAEAAATLYGQLEPFSGRLAIGHAEGSVGAVDRYLGLLAFTLGRIDDAIRHLTGAVAVNGRMGAHPWTAHSQHDLAELLRRRDEPGDRVRAGDLDRTAVATALRLGMSLAQRITESSDDEADAAPDAAVHAPAVFRREGEYWTIRFEGDGFRIGDAKGMHHLARLLEAAGHELHAIQLAQASASTPTRSASLASVRLTDQGGVGPALDAEATAAYRARLTELEEEVAEADSWNDRERVVRAQAEIDALTHELAAAVGLGGRSRSGASASERARLSVTRAIRAALARIAIQSPKLGEHFEATIRTGVFCSYKPDPRAPITWQL